LELLASRGWTIKIGKGKGYFYTYAQDDTDLPPTMGTTGDTMLEALLRLRDLILNKENF
jgi:hypothetical protein